MVAVVYTMLRIDKEDYVLAFVCTCPDFVGVNLHISDLA